MSYSVRYESKSNCVYVSVEGELNIALFKEMASEVGAHLHKHNCRRVLNDLREAHLPDSAGDIYVMPKRAVNGGVALNIKRALVVKQMGGEYKFLETVFLNQGNMVKLFDNMVDAEQWLFENGQ